MLVSVHSNSAVESRTTFSGQSYAWVSRIILGRSFFAKFISPLPLFLPFEKKVMLILLCVTAETPTLQLSSLSFTKHSSNLKGKESVQFCVCFLLYLTFGLCLFVFKSASYNHFSAGTQQHNTFSMRQRMA